MPIRLLTSEGGVSDELFEIVGPADRKNCIYVSDSVGNQMRVHKERVLPPDALGKLVAVMHGNKLKTACPICSRTLPVEGNTAECPVHGKLQITSHEHLNQDNTSKALQENKMSKTETVTMVDFAVVAQYGVELWTKQQLKFSDPHTDVQSHVLLADNPARKLCFNTYNGALGKKKTNTEDSFLAQLQAFKDGIAIEPLGTSVYPLKGTLDDARKKLRKTGYASPLSTTADDKAE
jgi:hypothetical protein